VTRDATLGGLLLLVGGACDNRASPPAVPSVARATPPDTVVVGSAPNGVDATPSDDVGRAELRVTSRRERLVAAVFENRSRSPIRLERALRVDYDASANSKSAAAMRSLGMRDAGNGWLVLATEKVWLRSACGVEPPECVTVAPGETLETVPWNSILLYDAQCPKPGLVGPPPAAVPIAPEGRYRFVVTSCDEPATTFMSDVFELPVL
jgi:hypothetical protein